MKPVSGTLYLLWYHALGTDRLAPHSGQVVHTLGQVLGCQVPSRPFVLSMLIGPSAEDNSTYREVIDSNLGVLYSLGAEVNGRWSTQAVELLPELARERSRGMHPRLRRSTALGLLHRWAGILAVGLQRGVSLIVVHDF